MSGNLGGEGAMVGLARWGEVPVWKAVAERRDRAMVKNFMVVLRNGL